MAKTTWDSASIEAQIAAAAFVSVVRITEAISEKGTELIQNPPKTGKIYIRRGIKHQASAPGEAPATDTTALASSATTSYNKEALSGRANWSVKYAMALELGTFKMAPRPFARPALDLVGAGFQQDLFFEISSVLKR